MGAAVLVAAAAIALPVTTNIILSRLPELMQSPNALWQLGGLGLVMFAAFAVQAIPIYFVDYRGHVMGARIEAQVRRDLFEHCSRRCWGWQKGGPCWSSPIAYPRYGMQIVF